MCHKKLSNESLHDFMKFSDFVHIGHVTKNDSMIRILKNHNLFTMFKISKSKNLKDMLVQKYSNYVNFCLIEL